MLDLAIALIAVAAAALMRPWRALDGSGPPWPWLAWWAAMPLTWGVDHLVANSVVQPLSGAPLLLMMAGWPLTVLALVPVALITTLLGHMPWELGLHRFVWLGLMPATLMMLFGAGVRRLLPHHLFVYIFGRGFFSALLAGTIAGWVSMVIDGTASSTLGVGDLMLGRWLAAWGDAFLTGMIVAIFVAFRPEWLATYSDRIYLIPPRP
ncbi:MAG: hypothetical protein AB9M60_22330 [Leptothrix sp. (in: b-proteobacteria)]